MTANTSPVMSFRRGGAAAEEADKENTASFGRRDRIDYLSLKEDQDKITVRLLTDHDEWIYVEQHSFVPTKAAPKDAEHWPKSMMAACRKDPAFAGHYTDCYICDAKVKNNFGKTAFSRIRIWALAIERELVRGDGSEALGGPNMLGAVVGVRDKVDEIDELDAEGNPTGTKLTYPRILVINMPMKGFFSHFKALHGLHRTVCDRDYEITREGKGQETNYRVAPIDPVPDLKPGTPAWEKYLQAVAEREVSLEGLVADKGSDQHYARFFDPTKDVDKDGNVIAATAASGGPASPAASGNTELRERLRNLGVRNAESETPPY
ncbi:hypothetical protein [Streptomyces albidoflavus]|uniref:hypothetical protein n=1 Tax=Streptomyces albidoflavus TaxID=1886 RepID=UPI00340F2C1F